MCVKFSLTDLNLGPYPQPTRTCTCRVAIKPKEPCGTFFVSLYGVFVDLV